MPLVRLNHLINGVVVPYSRACKVLWRRNGLAKVRIKGAADGHYRDRTVNESQLSHLESVDVETGLSSGIGCDASRDGATSGQAAAV